MNNPNPNQNLLELAPRPIEEEAALMGPLEQLLAEQAAPDIPDAIVNVGHVRGEMWEEIIAAGQIPASPQAEPSKEDVPMSLFKCAWFAYMKMGSEVTDIPDRVITPLTQMSPMMIISVFEMIDIKNTAWRCFSYKFITNMHILSILLKSSSVYDQIYKCMNTLAIENKLLVTLKMIQNCYIYIYSQHNPKHYGKPDYFIQVNITDAIKYEKYHLMEMLSTTNSSDSSSGKVEEEEDAKEAICSSNQITNTNNTSSNSSNRIQGAAYRLHNCTFIHHLPELNVPVISFGLRLGSLLMDSGWYGESVYILIHVAKFLVPGVCTIPNMRIYKALRIDCLRRLLDAETMLLDVKNAKDTGSHIRKLLDDMKGGKDLPEELLVLVHVSMANMCLALNEYERGDKWIQFAIRSLKDTFQDRTIINVLCTASRICTMKHEYVAAHQLITCAEYRALITYGANHYVYAETLNVFAFFLMNIHAYNASIQLYLQEKRIECDKWGGFGFRLVTAHENLARAHYMGDKAFSLQAKRYIIKAIERMEYMLPTTHFRFVPLYTLKTLIFAKEYTEINIDTLNDQNWDIYQQLLTQIFESSVKDLGENNLHTAIILGNMGKIYHILKRYTEAEQLLLKSLQIKREKLGNVDSEVAQTLSQLASLYAKALERYEDAEQLYLESIEIYTYLYGPDFSAIRSNYEGLCSVYEAMGNDNKYSKCRNIVEQWNLEQIYPVYIYQFIRLSDKKKSNLKEIKQIYAEKKMIRATTAT